ncbi:outer membrane beta-barrel protein [Parvularcula lutaonensis]|uniref:Outer membrane beta-barrel protein n=1 Tax=Parvularcula lutaonensis TaxID=491923 RepID=A0ABV7M7W0_9PROT|nr:outer membrane beta-barrel protein [Parvularcula lutaonensis]GGY41115.1 hypothetical protein GCM10007148_07120 [Parvularcula lutaonensis]
MKKLLLTAGVALASISTAHAGGGYIQVHGGLFQPTEDTVEFASDNFLGNILDQQVDSGADMGYAVGGLIGTYILPFIALEGEVTLRTTSTDDVSIGNAGAAITDDPRTIAFMGNAVLRPTLPLLPDPYIGIGAGYLTSNLETVDGEDVDGQFAYQVKAGVGFGFPLVPGTIGIEANYLATDDFDLSGDVGTDIVEANFAYGGFTGLVTWKIGF